MNTFRLSSFALTLVVGALSACSDSKESTGNSTGGSGSATSAPSATEKKPTPSANKPDATTPALPTSAASAASGIVMEGTVEFGDSGATVTWTGEGVECAAARCRDAQLTIPGVDLSPTVVGCCTSDERCGVDMALLGKLLGLTNPGCEVFEPPAKVDASCPKSAPIQATALALSGGGAVELEGCCQADGKCGFSADFSFIGFGCVDATRFGQKGGATCTP